MDIITDHDDIDDETEHHYDGIVRPMTPTRVLQVKFVGFVNALFNYFLWLREQDTERRARKGDME